jgi:hypothetical protein
VVHGCPEMTDRFLLLESKIEIQAKDPMGLSDFYLFPRIKFKAMLATFIPGFSMA